MKDYEDLNEWIEDGNKKVFDSHIANRINLPTGKNDCYIHFEAPETSNGWMDFIYCNGVLTIQGDYGNCAINFYNKNNTIETLSGFASNMEYFLSKLESAERSSVPNSFMKSFEQDVCIKEVKECLKDIEVDEEWKDEFKYWENNTYDYFEWTMFCRENGSNFFKDEDHWEYSYRMGEVLEYRAYLWCYGLIKAIEYLENNKNIIVDNIDYFKCQKVG